MNIFRCVKCNHVDHMDICYPHGEDLNVDLVRQDLFCTICQGKPWHNRLRRMRYVPEIHDVLNPPLETVTSTVTVPT